MVRQHQGNLRKDSGCESKTLSRSLNLLLSNCFWLRYVGMFHLGVLHFLIDRIPHLKTCVDEDYWQIGQLQINRHGNCQMAINYDFLKSDLLADLEGKETDKHTWEGGIFAQWDVTEECLHEKKLSFWKKKSFFLNRYLQQCCISPKGTGSPALWNIQFTHSDVQDKA